MRDLLRKKKKFYMRRKKVMSKYTVLANILLYNKFTHNRMERLSLKRSITITITNTYNKKKKKHSTIVELKKYRTAIIPLTTQFHLKKLSNPDTKKMLLTPLEMMKNDNYNPLLTISNNSIKRIKPIFRLNLSSHKITCNSQTKISPTLMEP
jgi:hypothetical protein